MMTWKAQLATVLVSLALLAPVGSRAAQSGDWTQFGYTDTTVYYARNGSFALERTQGGVEVASMLVQIYDKTTTSESYVKWYVSIADCNAGYGKLVTIDTHGNYLYQNDFVLSGDSIGSTGADILCSLYRQQLKVKSDKST
jgi:hypothetical protein